MYNFLHKYYCQILVALTVALMPLTVTADDDKDRIIWATWDYAPLFIVDGPNKNKGAFNIRLALLKQALPQYHHKMSRTMNANRFVSMGRKPNNGICANGMVDGNLYRKDYLYSIVAFHIVNFGIITQNSHHQKFGPIGQPVSLEHLLKSTDMLLGTIDSHPYTPKITAIIENYLGTKNFQIDNISAN